MKHLGLLHIFVHFVFITSVGNKFFLLVTPMDVVKVRLQQQIHQHKSVNTRIMRSLVKKNCCLPNQIILVTPFDVVKIRLQQQAHPFVKGSCFLYSNGLMDHLCTACVNSVAKESCEWFQRPSNFTGTKVLL